jgi:hypothetical protein
MLCVNHAQPMDKTMRLINYATGNGSSAPAAAKVEEETVA